MIDRTLGPLLEDIQLELVRVLGDRFDSIVLFGSRARGDAQPDSDIDVLIIMRGEFDYGDLLQRTSPGLATLSLKNDVVISRVFVSREQYDRSHSPFLLNVHRDGVAV